MGFGLVGAMAGLFLGDDGPSQELTPGLPLRLGFALKWKTNATAYNLELKFKMSDQPTESQITFTDIPVLE